MLIKDSYHIKYNGTLQYITHSFKFVSIQSNQFTIDNARFALDHRINL